VSEDSAAFSVLLLNELFLQTLNDAHGGRLSAHGSERLKHTLAYFRRPSEGKAYALWCDTGFVDFDRHEVPLS
jgi:hypothetical protein